jgi:predicted nuclease of predicted toxin-antitoxin system
MNPFMLIIFCKNGILQTVKFVDLQMKTQLTLITKDADFRNSFFIKKTPKKLIKINLGNISNEELKTIFQKYMDTFYLIDKQEMYMIEIGKHIISVFDNFEI